MNLTVELTINGDYYRYGMSGGDTIRPESFECLFSWVIECFEKQFAKYISEGHAAARKARKELEERQELARLKAKYETQEGDN